MWEITAIADAYRAANSIAGPQYLSDEEDERLRAKYADHG